MNKKNLKDTLEKLTSMIVILKEDKYFKPVGLTTRIYNKVVDTIEKMYQLNPKEYDNNSSITDEFWETLNKFGNIVRNNEKLKEKIYEITLRKSKSLEFKVEFEVKQYGRNYLEYNYEYFDGIINVYYNPTSFWLLAEGFLPERKKKEILKLGWEILEKYEEYTEKYPNYYISFKVLPKICDVCDIPKELYVNIMKKHIGRRYQYLNSYEYTKKINSIEDPIEKQKVINKHAETIKAILQQFFS